MKDAVLTLIKYLIFFALMMLSGCAAPQVIRIQATTPTSPEIAVAVSVDWR